jgi:paraquat-inducible protein A
MSNLKKPHMTACAECDMLLEDVSVPAGEESVCPRCGHVLREGRPDSVIHAVVLSTLGLSLFGPAIGLPLLSLSVTGLRRESSLAQAVLSLGDSGFWEVATMVSICSIIAPLLNLWLLFTISVTLHLGHAGSWLPGLMRLNHQVREWAMLEVFLMGVLVSIVKLKDIAALLPGMGLYCFVCLMLCALLLNTVIDEHELWQTYENNRAKLGLGNGRPDIG